MKRFFKLLSLVMVLALTLTVAACAKKVTIALSKTELTIAAGETATISATVTNSDVAVTWSSSDEKIATISGENEATVTAVAVGSAVITATIGKVSVTATVTVTTSKDQLAATAVIAKIQALPATASIKATDETAIKAARTDYDALTTAGKALVTNLATLTKAEKQIEAIKAAAAVTLLIGALPAADAVALTDEDAINAADAAYEALSATAQALVAAEDSDKLSECVDALATLLSLDETYRKRATAIDTAITAIGGADAITLDTITEKKALVEAARKDYDAALPAIKEYITMLDELVTLEKKVETIEAEAAQAVIDAANVDAKIAAISTTPTLDDKTAITEARTAYEALSAYAKTLISNLDTLKGYETIITNREAAATIDAMITALPDPTSVTASNEAAITAARKAFDGASAEVAAYLTGETRLVLCEEALAYAKDPATATIAYLHKVYDSAYLTNSQILLAKYYTTDISWAYAASAANTDYYDLATGKILKGTPYEFVQTTITATVSGKTADITFNLGIKGAAESKIIYTTGAASTTGTDIKDGGGTYEQMLAALGFDGLAIQVVSEESADYAGYVGNIYLAGLNALINLDESSDPDSDGYIEAAQLRTVGDLTQEGVQYFLNCGLAAGAPAGYKGSFFVYHNVSSKAFTFNPGWLYGRNSANNYGYTKIIFAPNGDGTYYLKNDIGGSTNGTNLIPTGVTQAKDADGNGLVDADGNMILVDNRSYTVTLEPDEYIICSHTFNTSSTNGDQFCGRTGLLQKGVVLRFVDYTTDAPQSLSIAATDSQDIEKTLTTTSVQLGATLEPVFASQEVEWSSSDSAVATVDSTGLVTKVTNGKVTITATSKLDSGIKASVDLFFHDGVLPTMTLTDTEKSAQVTDSFTLAPTVTPDSYAAGIVWSSTDDAIATVSAKGLVTVKSVGSATITGTLEYMNLDGTMGELAVSCVVTGTVITEHNNILIDASAKDGDVKIAGKYEYTFGTNLFADVAAGVAAAKDGGIVFIAAGTYTPSAAIVLPMGNITIQGVDAETAYSKETVFDATAAISLLENTIFDIPDGFNDVKFLGLTFDGSSQIRANGTNSGITIENCLFNALASLKPNDTVNDGSLFFNNGTNIAFINNAFTGAFKSPRVMRFATGTDVTIKGNVFTDSYTWVDGDVGSMDIVRIEGSVNGKWLITDNIFQNAQQSALMFRSNGASDILIQNNYFSNVTAALWTRRYTGVTNILIFANYFTKCDNGWDVLGSEAGTNFIVRYNAFAADNTVDPANNCALICNNKNASYLYGGVTTYTECSNNYIDAAYPGLISLVKDDESYKNAITSFDGLNLVTGSSFSALALGGITATTYASLDSAIEAVAASSEIILLGGIEAGGRTLKKVVTLTSVLQGIAVEGHESLYASKVAPQITEVLFIDGSASTASVKNLGITGNGRILVVNGSGTIAGPTFDNLYGHDNTWTPVAYAGTGILNAGSNTASVIFAMISVQPTYVWVTGTTFTNCVFKNITGAAISITCAQGATFTDNVFDTISYDAIRFTYSSGVGDNFLFDGNTFKNIDYCGIFYRGITGAYTPAATITVTNNTFDNVASKASEGATLGNPIACLASRGYSEKQNVTIVVKFNTFGLCGNYLGIRDNVTNASTFAKSFTTTVEYNSFHVAAAGTKISESFTSADSATTNKGDFLFDFNFIYTEADSVQTAVTATYDAILAASNTTVYTSQADLDAAIAALAA